MIDLATLASSESIDAYRDTDLTITVSRTIRPLAIDLLKRTIYGTAGVTYQHTDHEPKILALLKPLFFHLFQADQFVGIYCLDERLLDQDSQPITAFYGRYLAVEQAHTGNGYGRLLKQQAVAFVETNATAPFLFYSYIEAKNSRSMAISHRAGFRPIATLKTYLFRRFSPQTDPRFSPATADDLPALRNLLGQFYKQYRFKTFAHIGYRQHYFVLRESGRIVAGVQANPVRWRFHRMAGIKGWLLMHLVPRFSISRRFFNPDNNDFLVLEGLYVDAGRQELLAVLLESVLAHFGQHSAMCELDQRDPLIPVLVSKAMGPLSGFENGIATHVLVKTVGSSGLSLFTDRPLYTSCFDYA